MITFELQRKINAGMTTPRFLLMTSALILSLVGVCLGEFDAPLKDVLKKESSTISILSTVFKTSNAEPLETTMANTVTSTTKEAIKTINAYVPTENPTTIGRSTARVYASTKGVAESAKWQKLHSGSSVLGTKMRLPVRSQKRLGPADCDLPVLPRESRLWRGNETHELKLPLTVKIIFNLL